MYNFLYLFLQFMIYSIFGYIVETISILIVFKGLNLNRGFFIGPYLPIFGLGGLIINYGLIKYENDLVALFIVGMVLCTLLEYISSYLLEKIFKLRWWNYYDKRFNINGRVCLEGALSFGLAAVFILKIFNPIVFTFINNLSKNTIIIISSILLIVFIIDFIITIYTLINLRLNTKDYFKKDATRAIKKEIKENLKNIVYYIKDY